MNQNIGSRIISLIWPVSIGFLVVYYLISQYIFTSSPKWFGMFFWVGISLLIVAVIIEIISKQDITKPRYFTQSSANFISILLKLLLAGSLILRFLDIKYGIICLLLVFLLLLCWNAFIMMFPDDEMEQQKNQNLLDD